MIPEGRFFFGGGGGIIGVVPLDSHDSNTLYIISGQFILILNLNVSANFGVRISLTFHYLLGGFPNRRQFGRYNMPTPKA